MIKGAIFDMDGTVLDTMGMWAELASGYVRAQGRTPEAGIDRKLFTMSMPEGSAYLRSRYRIERTEEEISADIAARIRRFYAEEVEPKPGMPAYLHQLHEAGVPMVTATTCERGLIENALRHVGLRGYFREIFTCAELGTSKREPKIYRAAAVALGLPPGDCWVYEDALYAVRTARAAGFRTVAVYDAHNEEEQMALRETAERYVGKGEDISEIGI